MEFDYMHIIIMLPIATFIHFKREKFVHILTHPLQLSLLFFSQFPLGGPYGLPLQCLAGAPQLCLLPQCRGRLGGLCDGQGMCGSAGNGHGIPRLYGLHDFTSAHGSEEANTSRNAQRIKPQRSAGAGAKCRRMCFT